jgi:ribosomal protein S27E
MNRISPELLRQLRNEVDLGMVIEHLGIPAEQRGQQLKFRCPDCGSSDAVTSTHRNLAMCFQCQRNFNPIDLVMAERGYTFLEAIGCRFS